MDKIIIRNLEVLYHIGVGEVERSSPQRLLLNLELERDFTRACQSDDLADTIDYFQVCQRLIRLGEDHSWRLIEKLAADIIELLFREFPAETITVEVRKMIIPETEYVAFVMRRSRQEPPA